ncbi:DoxX family protein [Paraflavitalea pollutisoli]|uniref:DoxX family protein n=1 Tax=Paraflavitalea pollutisoli TaxID=3034143 RepID=UPI0023EB5247|nr:DoxX family protein [Paraflavitalea sp. H1-2-19X]
MRSTKLVYYITTALVSLMMTYAAISYCIDPNLEAAFDHLGFRAYFRIELAIAKMIGVALLWLPVAAWIREWTYAAFTIVFISAFISHTAMGDPLMARIMPIIFLVLHLASYVSWRILRYTPDTGKPY